MAWGVDDGATMSATVDAVSYTNNANFLNYITNGAETIDVQAQFGTSTVPLGFASDGFRYNTSNASATNAQLLFYLVIQGGQWDVGTTTLPDGAASTRTITGMAFQPSGLLVAHAQTSADATVELEAASMVGAATSTSTEASAGLEHQDAIGTGVTRDIHNDKIIGTLMAAARAHDFTTFTADGWTITAEGTSSFAPQLGWFAMASAASVTVGKKPFAALLAHRRFNYVP